MTISRRYRTSFDKATDFVIGFIGWAVINGVFLLIFFLATGNEPRSSGPLGNQAISSVVQFWGGVFTAASGFSWQRGGLSVFWPRPSMDLLGSTKRILAGDPASHCQCGIDGCLRVLILRAMKAIPKSRLFRQ
jgi:hypothetical protein